MIQTCPNIKTVKEETGTDWQQIGLKTLAILLVPGPEDGVGGTPDPGGFGGAGEGRAGFAGDRRWDMGDREWSCFKLKRQLKGLNLEK
jgi:hypothetical protein